MRRKNTDYQALFHQKAKIDAVKRKVMQGKRLKPAEIALLRLDPEFARITAANVQGQIVKYHELLVQRVTQAGGRVPVGMNLQHGPANNNGRKKSRRTRMGVNNASAKTGNLSGTLPFAKD